MTDWKVTCIEDQDKRKKIKWNSFPRDGKKISQHAEDERSKNKEPLKLNKKKRPRMHQT